MRGRHRARLTLRSFFGRRRHTGPRHHTLTLGWFL